MKKLTLLMLLAAAMPGFAVAESWTNVPILDTQCSAKLKAEPDNHTRECAMACADSGFGIVDKSGNYLRFDAKGNKEATRLLENTLKRDHLRVNVNGIREGDVIHVQSLSM